MTMNGRRAGRAWGRLWLAALVAFGLAPCGRAQRDGAAGRLDSVFLDTDAAAAKKLGAARDLLAARQWNDGIELVRQISEQHGDRLVAITPGRYVNVHTYCDVLLSGLPDEGIREYRARVDPQARRWFEAARAERDEEGLRRILRRAFLSSYGDDALLLLGQLAWEQGKLSRARSYWEQLIPAGPPAEPGQIPVVLRYPASDLDAAQVRARLVLCSLMQGETARGKRELAAFRKLHPQATGTIAGQTGLLADILAAQAELSAAGAPAAQDSEPHTFAANPQRNQVQSGAVDVGSVQWSAPLNAVRVERPHRGDEPFEKFPFDRAERWGTGLPQDVLCYYPVLYGNLVLYADESAVYARELLSAEGGKPAWGDDPAIYRLPRDQGLANAPVRRAGLPRYTVTVESGRLYARLGGGSARGRNRVPASPASVLVCLDLGRQGDLVWNLKSDEIDGEGGVFTFDGTPLVHGGRVYVALRRKEPQLQLNVACFDAETARLIWNRKVCLGMEGFGPEFEDVHHQLLTFADERIYYCTNLGAIACLEAQDGSPRWIATYPRTEIDSVSGLIRRQLHGPNPCLYHNGQVFAAPTDSNHVLALDAETGLVQWDHELKGNVHQLVGVHDGTLVAAGDLLYAFDAESGRIAWISGRTDPEAATRGRAAIGGGLVYWPRREELLLVEVATGETRRRIDLPAQHNLRGGGNVTLTEGMLLLAQADRLAVFSEFGSLRKQREERLAQRPDDPRPHFELALLAEAMRDPPGALVEYRRARDLARPDDFVAGEPLKARAARRLSQLLMQLGGEAAAAMNWDEAVACLTQAVECADSPDRQVEARIALAGVHEQRGAAEEAVGAWQSLLDSSPIGGDDGSIGRPSVSRQARAAIDRLIGEYGRGIYAAVEATAERSFADSIARRDQSGTAALLARFPNAFAAEEAALRLAALQRESGDRYGADRTFKELLEGKPRDRNRAAALVGLAEIAESWRAERAAAPWWPPLYDRHANLQVAVGGIPRLVHELVPERMARISARSAQPERSGFRPLVRRWNRDIRESTRVIVPEGTAPSDELRCVLIAGPTLTCLEPVDGSVRWELALGDSPRRAGFIADLLVIGGTTTVAAIAPDSGRILWQRDFSPVARGDAPELSMRLAGDRIYCLSPDSGLWSLVPETGQPAWRYRPAQGALQRCWHCDAERILVQRLRPEWWEVLSPLDGSVVAQFQGPSEACSAPFAALPADHLLALADRLQAPKVIDLMQGTTQCVYQGPVSRVNAPADVIAGETALVAVIDADTLARFDPLSGRPLWSCRAGAAPLREPRESTCFDREHLYVATGGVVRAIALDSGRLQWEQYLGPPGEWRLQRVGSWLAAAPRAAAEGFCVVLCDPASGTIIERLKGDGPASDIRFHSDGAQALLATDRRLVGYRPLAAPAE